MTTKTIAVIDDDRMVRATLEAILKDAGYAVILAADATEVARVMENEDIGLIITDLLMPDRNGFDTIRDIRRRRPDVKIIAISGAIPAQGGTLVELVGALGASHVLAKPFLPSQIVKLIEQLLPE